MVMTTSFMAAAAGARRAMNIVGIYGEEQRHHVARGRAVEGRRNTVEEEEVSSTDKEIDNHHNIPRQKYDDWGGNSPDNGDSNDDGSG
ncbi:hypothetical protein CCACVL1_17799 [Corchorus capsularis]|uniref:Uncharacterized protein n=1 Tax=Corchorus capsularis TaxID=210143 RepID=A0A1R3HPY3_COCAP|nr:hypothetical protein CCACVL1_17799 [Corchorus capsularis]